METPRFEEALKKLEKIVSDLETGELSLDEALKKYEEGVKLTRVCTEKLQQAEKKIEVLSKELDGSFSTREFEETENETSHPKRIRTVKKVKKE